MKHRLMLAAIIAGLLLCAAACSDSKPSYSHFEEIGAGGWDPLDVLQFEVMPPDSGATFLPDSRISMVTRFSSRHKGGKIPVALTFEDMEGRVRTDTIIIDSTDAEKDSGNSGKVSLKPGVREIEMDIDAPMPIREGMHISLTTLAPQSATSGLLNVGIIVYDKKDKR